MTDHERLLSAVTDHDRKESRKKGHSPYALAHYVRGVQRVTARVARGEPVRDAIITEFNGLLCDRLLRAFGLATMTLEEAKYGLAERLPPLDEEET